MSLARVELGTIRSSALLGHYVMLAPFSTEHTNAGDDVIKLLDEIERLQLKVDWAMDSIKIANDAVKHTERYRKALEDIAYDTELNITDSYQMVLHARKTLKGDETT